MTDKIKCEIMVAVNDDGHFVVCKDDTDVVELMNDEYGGCAIRVLKLNVHVTPPTPIEVNVNIAAEAGETIQVDQE